MTKNVTNIACCCVSTMRGNPQADRQRDDQIDRSRSRTAAAGCRASARRTPGGRPRSPIVRSIRPSAQNGSSLAAMNWPRVMRRDVELFERAQLLLARDVLRAQQRADQRHQRDQDARHHVVLIVRASGCTSRATRHVDGRRSAAPAPVGRRDGDAAERRLQRDRQLAGVGVQNARRRTPGRCRRPIPSPR